MRRLSHQATAFFAVGRGAGGRLSARRFSGFLVFRAALSARFRVSRPRFCTAAAFFRLFLNFVPPTARFCGAGRYYLNSEPQFSAEKQTVFPNRTAQVA